MAINQSRSLSIALNTVKVILLSTSSTLLGDLIIFSVFFLGGGGERGGVGFTPCKAEQPLEGMGLQEKETQKD